MDVRLGVGASAILGDGRVETVELSDGSLPLRQVLHHDRALVFSQLAERPRPRAEVAALARVDRDRELVPALVGEVLDELRVELARGGVATGRGTVVIAGAGAGGTALELALARVDLERDAEIAERTRIERSRLTLADRLRGPRPDRAGQQPEGGLVEHRLGGGPEPPALREQPRLEGRGTAQAQGLQHAVGVAALLGGFGKK